MLLSLMEIIREVIFFLNRHFLDYNKIMLLDMYGLFFSDGTWERGLAYDKHGDVFSVYLVDRGTDQRALVAEMRPLPAPALQPPACANQVRYNLLYSLQHTVSYIFTIPN